MVIQLVFMMRQLSSCEKRFTTDVALVGFHAEFRRHLLSVAAQHMIPPNVSFLEFLSAYITKACNVAYPMLKCSVLFQTTPV
jgi:hypothetical protein